MLRAIRGVLEWSQPDMMKKKSAYRVAVVGATGAVGTEMIQVLEERNFPVGELIPLASARSEGNEVMFRGESLPVKVLEPHSFQGVDVALFSAGAMSAKNSVQLAVKAGAVVVDNSSAWRMDPKVPLVVPEVNAAGPIGTPGYYCQSQLLNDSDGRGLKTSA